MSTLARTCFRTMHSDFPQKIVSWYRVNGRKDLPWRRGISGYRIWISEIMLQQTQVKTVIPYYQKFIKSFPSLSKLLQASEDEILSLWSGLGFYRRAKNIYKSCRIIETNFSGRFPRTFDDLIQKYSIKSIDKLQIDVEGAEYKIMNSINFQKIEINKILFESKHFDGTFIEGKKLQEIEEKLKSNGYKLQQIDKENILASK